MQQTPVKKNNTGSASTDSDNWIITTINMGLKLGGKMVPQEEYEWRLEQCRACPLVGEVEIKLPLKTLRFEGCTSCGCPLATKPKWDTYYSLPKFKFVKAQCPHPEGDRWQRTIS